MKKSFSFLITSIILSCTLLACQQDSSFPVDNSESDQSGQYKHEESSIDNTNQVDLKGKKVVSILSGGNIDVTLLSRLIDVALRNLGRKVEISTTIPDKPGALAHLLEIISKTGANIIRISHNRLSKRVKVMENNGFSVEIL